MTEKHELAYKDYKQGMKYKDIAEKHGVSLSAVKSWATRYWKKKSRNQGNKKLQPKDKKVATKKVAKEKKQQKNRSGNPNPENKFTKGNSPDVSTHGFFRKIFPEEAHELVESIMEKSALDMLWENIVIQYTAIARAQQIMFVVDKDDIVKEVKKKRVSESVWSTESSRTDKETEYELQFAWDRHANYLMAQSKAMGILTSMIKRFKDMAGDDDERRLKLETMVMDLEEAKVKKAKAEATVAEKVAGKLVGDTKSHDLMKSLIDVVSGGTGVAEDS